MYQALELGGHLLSLRCPVLLAGTIGTQISNEAEEVTFRYHRLWSLKAVSDGQRQH